MDSLDGTTKAEQEALLRLKAARRGVNPFRTSLEGIARAVKDTEPPAPPYRSPETEEDEE